ncbi:MAG: glutathione S-transferase N-terminal domain-containing protein [Pseudomonadota bacterium]
MIDFYAFSTPNGRKVAIALEELGLAYKVLPIDISKGEQMQPAFLKISPNNKIPAIVDHEPPDGAGPLSVFESAAIISYLAQKVDSPILGHDLREQVAVQEWANFQMASLGPMFGQFGHFWRYAKDDVPYAKARYRDEAVRIMGVMERRLGEVPYLAGPSFTMADILSYAWTASFLDLGRQADVDTDAFTATKAWLHRCAERPGVQRGMEVKLTH